MNSMLKFLKTFIEECQKKHLITLASSSTFFFSLCIIPLTLLSLSFFNQFIFYDSKPIISFVEKLKLFLPDEIYSNINSLLALSGNILAENDQVGFIHYLILIFSSLSFFGSIWKAVDIISEVEPSKTIMRRLKSFLTIAGSFGFILILTFVPIILRLINYILNSDIAKYLQLNQLTFITEHSLAYHLLSYVLLFLFFYIFFKFLLRIHIEKRYALISSVFFGLGLYISRFIFFMYINYTKSSLIFKFGSVYSILVFLFWIFTLILLFFSAINLTLCLQKFWGVSKLPSSSSVQA